MGGLAGHMSHLYGDVNLKLSEIIKLISGIKSGEVQFNEKADGQNIFVTMTPDRQVRFARNKTDFKNVGRSIEQLKTDFTASAQKRMGPEFNQNEIVPQVEIFGDGCKAIEEVLLSLSNETFNMVFLDTQMPKTYINCEIIHSNHPNLVLYEKNHIQFHEFQVFGDVTYETIEGLNLLNDKFSKFIKEVSGQEVDITSARGKKSTFSIDGPRFLPPRNQALNPEELNLFEQQSDQAITALQGLFNSAGLTPQNTIGDYYIAKLEDEILNEFGIPNEILSDISHYLVYKTDASGNKIRSKRAADSGGVESLKPFKLKIQSLTSKELADKFTLGKYKSFQNGLLGIALSPIKDIIHAYSLSIVNTAASVIASDPGLARYATRMALSDMNSLRHAIQQDLADQPERLEKYLEKFDRELTLLGNVEDFAQSMEGIVINYVREDGMPMLYKLTGNFAPANQLLGMSSQGFEIKRNLLNKAKQEYSQMKHVPEPDDLTPLSESKIRKIIRVAIKNYLFESPMSHMEKPGTGSETNAEKFARTGKNIGYSPVQDIDKLIEPIISSGLVFFPPTTAITGAYLGAKTVKNITKDIIDIYLNDKKSDFQKKKDMYNYIKNKGVEKTVSSLPVGKIPGAGRLAGKLSKLSLDIAEEAYKMMIDSAKTYGQEKIKNATDI